MVIIHNNSGELEKNCSQPQQSVCACVYTVVLTAVPTLCTVPTAVLLQVSDNLLLCAVLLIAPTVLSLRTHMHSTVSPHALSKFAAASPLQKVAERVVKRMEAMRQKYNDR